VDNFQRSKIRKVDKNVVWWLYVREGKYMRNNTTKVQPSIGLVVRLKLWVHLRNTQLQKEFDEPEPGDFYVDSVTKDKRGRFYVSLAKRGFPLHVKKNGHKIQKFEWTLFLPDFNPRIPL
jgi:hypothetical protein